MDQLRLGERQRVIRVDQQVPVWRCNIDGGWADLFPLFGLLHLQGGTPTQNVSHEAAVPRVRSEEHTSELQSHSDLVCRLLLEKKNPVGPCFEGDLSG